MTERGQGRNRTALGITAVIALLALVALAWLAEGLLTSPEDIPPVQIVRNGTVLAEFTIDELRQFPKHRISQLGKWEEGPALLDVLEAAGVTDFDRLIVTGQGVRDSGKLELEWDEVTGDVVLDFANRGTVKIAGPDISWIDRVRDVTRLEVE